MKLYALGPAGTYGHEAAEMFKKRSAGQISEIELLSSHVDVFEKTDAQADDACGLVAVENSTEGYVGEVLKFWMNHGKTLPLVVMGEHNLKINHCLLGNRKRMLVDTPTVLSHKQALGQCRDHLAQRKLLHLRETFSTAEAARLVARDSNYRDSFAIASQVAAEAYGLEIVEQGIQDSAHNTTRFHVLGLYPPKPTGRDRTAVLLWPKENVPGVLESIGKATRKRGVQQTAFHSIPLGPPGHYVFYSEFEEHSDSKVGREIMKDLWRLSSQVVPMGSYPREEM